ncbi:MAG TPA: hypothetical protein VHB21_09145 [Minicystis sp.]|nr:hypothetical protein [Minicystis sp.]
MKLVRMVFAAFTVSALVVGGCSSKRFGALESGTYACRALVTSNDCGINIGTKVQSVTLQGGGTNSVSLGAPSEAAISGSNDWSTVQFGSQADPNTYAAHGVDGCGAGQSYAYEEKASLETVHENQLTFHVNYDYSNIAACGFSSATENTCTLAFEVTCTLSLPASVQ